MGQLWRVLIVGAISVIRAAKRRGTPKGSWLARMLNPLKLVAVTVANKIARTALGIADEEGTIAVVSGQLRSFLGSGGACGVG